MGWAPVRWRHHPDEIKILIREAGLSPQAKACYTNCGRVMLTNHYLGNPFDVTYCEGTFHREAGISVPHAWLRFCDETVDLTIVDGAGSRYETKLELTAEQLAERCRATGRFGPFVPPDVNFEALAALNRTLSVQLVGSDNATG